MMALTTLTRVAHACVLLDFDGHMILTDPWLSEKTGYYQGEKRAFDTAADLPPLSGVVISHGHYDHFDMEAFAAYPDKTVPMAVKRGLAAKARSYGFSNVTELDAWETTDLGPVRVTAAPAKHKVPEVTFVLESAGSRVFFGADTMRIAELDDIAHRFGPIDLALLPINGLTIRPLLNRQVVMNAVEAADLTRTLRPRLAVPIHYAFTGGPTRDRLLLKMDPRPEMFLDAAADIAPDTKVHILPPGEPLTL
jgi:L-ascorbate metabolism protein UlaG (beta-lactamase superfamily)